ncbi:MAG: trypsin-like serine protease [Planctomycetota bacterium]
MRTERTRSTQTNLVRRRQRRPPTSRNTHAVRRRNTARQKWSLAVAVVLGVGSPACAGVIRDDVDDALYTGLAADPAYAAVGKLTWNEPGLAFLGSGTLIAEDWVLTAGHNLDGVDGAGDGVSNVTFNVGGTSYAAEQWVLEPTWESIGGDTLESNFASGWDLALVKLSAPVVDVDPAVLYGGNDELGRVATTVGFGATGVGSTGFEENSAGVKRAGQNVIDVVGTAKTPGSRAIAFNVDNDRVLGVDFDEPGNRRAGLLGSDDPLDLEYLIAPGDSGGGLFIDVDGETQLAGVTSFGQSLDADGVNSDYGDFGGFTRVSSFVDWIHDTIVSVDGASGHGGGSATPLPGDYNGDGLIDAADYAVWQSQVGETGDGLAADGNADGVVDAADYTVWRDGSAQDYGDLVASLAVPEPSSALLAIMGALLTRRPRPADAAT